MTLIKVGETETEIQVNGQTEKTNTQSNDTTYNVDVSANATADTFYRANINTTYSPYGDNQRAYILRGGTEHPEFSVDATVTVDSSDGDTTPIYYSGASTTIDDKLGVGQSRSWTDSGTGSVTFYVEDDGFYSPTFSVDFTMEYTGVSATASLSVNSVNEV